jgi:hypothetical protein
LVVDGQIGPALERVSARVRELAEAYEPPTFSHVPDADAAIFLCAIDHRTGYRGRFLVEGKGPLEGSALLWAVGLQAARREAGLLTANHLREISAGRVAEVFSVGGETVTGPEDRARLWRDLATGLTEQYGGEADGLMSAAAGKLGGADGLLTRLAEFEAYSDPLQKKSFLFAKIAERRGWLAVEDPECWQVCADNVLMRLALRSGLVGQGEVNQVRAATREAFGRVAAITGLEPPVLDDLLWELGGDDPDLLGDAAGALQEPPRPDGKVWY